MDLKSLIVFCGFVCLMQLGKVKCVPVNVGDTGPGVYHAAVVGNYAGQLTGGLALNEVKRKVVSVEKQNEDEHDFSEAAAPDDPSLYESVGPKGDHLNERYFPDDYENRDQRNHQAEEYAEEGSQSSASDHREDVEASDEFEDHDRHESVQRFQESYENQIDYGGHSPMSSNDDFYGKPVPGIDHGNGAYSYSTTYEFPKY